jgi:HK97 family phage major capsid protein
LITPKTGDKTVTDEKRKDDDVQQMVDAVKETVDSQVAPLVERQTALEGQITGLSQPNDKASQLFGGGAPGVRVGENPMHSEGYSFLKALGIRQGFLKPENAKYELDVHSRLHQHYVEQGGMTLSGANSMLVPLGSSHIANLDTGFGTELRQAMAQSIAGADADQAKWVAQKLGGSVGQAISWSSDPAGALVANAPLGELIELIRAKSVLDQAGATEISLPPNGKIDFPRHTSGLTAAWVGENAAISSSEMGTDTLSLTAKKLAGLVKLPNELIRYATPSIEAFVRDDLATTLALKADQTMLDGNASATAPGGIITTSGINTVLATTVATNGNTFGPADPGRMAAAVLEDNFDTGTAAYLMRPELFVGLYNSRADAISGGDKEGPFMFATNRGQIENGLPPRLFGHPVYVSTQINKVREKGSDAALTYVLFGVFKEWMIARAGVLEFATSTQGDTPFANDQTWVRAIMSMDAGARHAKAFTLCDVLKNE